MYKKSRNRKPRETRLYVRPCVEAFGEKVQPAQTIGHPLMKKYCCTMFYTIILLVRDQISHWLDRGSSLAMSPVGVPWASSQVRGQLYSRTTPLKWMSLTNIYNSAFRQTTDRCRPALFHFRHGICPPREAICAQLRDQTASVFPGMRSLEFTEEQGRCPHRPFLSRGSNTGGRVLVQAEQ